jgi:lysozyme family protein
MLSIRDGGSSVTTFDFNACLAFVLKWEGGYVNNPADPGGATNKGITQNTYNTWQTQQSQATQDVKLITDAEIQQIYQKNYWTPSGADRIPARLNLVEFDTAVNMGVGRAVQFLQQQVGTTVDGGFGPITQKAANSAPLEATITQYCDAREAYYRNIVAKNPSEQVFLNGWLNRLNALRAAAGVQTPSV